MHAILHFHNGLIVVLVVMFARMISTVKVAQRRLAIQVAV
jgi:hypothetical protein